MMAETRMAWLVPDRVIYAQGRTQNLEEMRAAVDLAVGMMEQSNATTVHHLIDQRGLSSAMEDVDISAANRDLSRFLKHPKTGWILTCYGDNMYIQYVNWVLAHENMVRSRHFDTAQEAVDFLMSEDESLGDMPDVDDFIRDFDQNHR